ncbi:MAG: PAS domain S-box protein [Deltaproteobacteria bacterium]|nr:PAS domain S-box protein [Deltaproteobacteria bacterium]
MTLPRFFRQVEREVQKRTLLVPWIIAFLILAVTAWGFIDASIFTKERTQNLFREQTNQIKEKITARIESYEKILVSTKAFFEQGYSINHNSWQRYVRILALKENFPELKAVEYIESGRAHFPDSMMRQAAEVSRDTGRHALSSKIMVRHEKNLKAGFYQLMPIYQSGVAVQELTVFERRNSLRGWVYGLFVAEKFLQDIAAPEKSNMMLAVYDGLEPNPESLLFSTFSGEDGSLLKEESTIKVGDHFWALSFHSLPAFHALVNPNRPYYILGVGLCLTLLLFFTTHTLIEKKEMALKHLNSILKSSDDAIITETLDGTIVSWNAGAEKLYGYTAYETVGHNISMLVPENKERETGRILNKIGYGIVVDHYETRHARKDGRIIDVALTSSPIKNASGVVVGALTVEKSFTPSKEAEYAVPHHFYELVTKIATFGRHLQSHASDMDETNRDYLDRLCNSAFQLEKTLEKLTVFSKISTRTESFTPVNLEKIVQETVSGLEMHLSRSKSRVVIGPLPVLKADAVRMRQLFQTLILNALHFAKKGQNFNINIQSTLLQNGSVQIRVEDDGMGVDEKYIEKLFHPFEPIHYKGGYEDVAWNFAMCRKIVTHHGGQIVLKSAPNRGSSVIITLPIG